MALHFVLDGYNMVMRLPELFKKSEGLSFEASREGLVNFLSRYRPQGNVRNPVTIVFDGYAAMKMSWGRLRQEGIGVLFSEEESADDRIVHVVQKLVPRGPTRSQYQEIVVITDDRELSLRVRDLEAKVVSIKEFVARIVDKQKKVSAAREDKEKKLTPQEEQKITEELKKLIEKKKAS